MKNYTEGAINTLSDFYGKKTFIKLLESPYSFDFSIPKNDYEPKAVCKINGKVCLLEITYKSGAYNSMKFYNILFRKQVVFSATSLDALFSSIESAKKLFA